MVSNSVSMIHTSEIYLSFSILLEYPACNYSYFLLGLLQASQMVILLHLFPLLRYCLYSDQNLLRYKFNCGTLVSIFDVIYCPFYVTHRPPRQVQQVPE